MEMLYCVENGIIMAMTLGHGRHQDITDYVYRLAKVMDQEKK
jgi:hypothetical protein